MVIYAFINNDITPAVKICRTKNADLGKGCHGMGRDGQFYHSIQVLYQLLKPRIGRNEHNATFIITRKIKYLHLHYVHAIGHNSRRITRRTCQPHTTHVSSASHIESNVFSINALNVLLWRVTARAARGTHYSMVTHLHVNIDMASNAT